MIYDSKDSSSPDDTSSVIERHLENFQKFTVPILDYYRYSAALRDRLLTMDGEQTPEAVAREIARQLKSI